MSHCWSDGYGANDKKGDLETFGDIAVNLSKAIHGLYRYADTLVFTPDRYDLPQSIRCFKLNRRTTSN